MLGFNFERVPVSGQQAKALQEKMQRIMQNNLNADDLNEIRQREKYLQSRKQYQVIWED